MKPAEIIKVSKKKATWIIILLCFDCGRRKEASYKYYETIKHKMVYRCIKCAAKRNAEITGKNVKERWKDAEYRKAVTEAIKDRANEAKHWAEMKRELRKINQKDDFLGP